MPRIVKIFIGGGGDTWFGHIVESYAADYARLNPSYECSYFSWTDRGDIRKLLDQLPNDAAISVVGHSYGGDTAFSAIQGRTIDLLISIDPVGRFKASWTSVRPHCKTWLNVRAEPSDARRTSDDTIAAIGGKYPRPPVSGQPGAPNYAYIANQTHGAFRAMMRGNPGEISGQLLLGGHNV